MRDVNRGNYGQGQERRDYMENLPWPVAGNGHAQLLPFREKEMPNIQSGIDSGLFLIPLLHVIFFNLIKYVGWPRFPPTGLVIISHLFCLLSLLAVRSLWWERSVMELEICTCKGKRLFTITTPILFHFLYSSLQFLGTTYSSAQNKDKLENHGNKP